MLKDVGVPYAVLRNGWYSENLTPLIPPALAQHELLGAAGDGRISSAERRDYAAAAAAVILSEDDRTARIYECAGDAGYTLSEFAAEVSRQSGATVGYRNLSEADYDAALRAAGFPATLASILSTSHTAVADGELFDDGGDLARLIGRPTTPISRTIADVLASS